MNTIKLQFCLFIMNFLTPVQQKFIYHRMTVKLINIDKRKRSDQVLLRRSDTGMALYFFKITFITHVFLFRKHEKS